MLKIDSNPNVHAHLALSNLVPCKPYAEPRVWGNCISWSNGIVLVTARGRKVHFHTGCNGGECDKGSTRDQGVQYTVSEWEQAVRPQMRPETQ